MDDWLFNTPASRNKATLTSVCELCKGTSGTPRIPMVVKLYRTCHMTIGYRWFKWYSYISYIYHTKWCNGWCLTFESFVLEKQHLVHHLVWWILLYLDSQDLNVLELIIEWFSVLLDVSILLIISATTCNHSITSCKSCATWRIIQ